MVRRKVIMLIYILVNFIKVPLTVLFSGFHIKCSIIELFRLHSSIQAIDGGHITIGPMTSIDNYSLIRASSGTIEIGRNVYINRNCNIVSHQKISIGSQTTIGPNVAIYDHDHNYKRKDSEDSLINSAEISIGERVWIGSNCSILKGVSIGNDSVIAAGSIVTHDIPSDSVFVQKRVGEIKSK